MATVYIGSARIDENGHVSGGQQGDQNGREVATQTWYLHSDGWVIIRAINPAMWPLLAAGMRYACANNNIGYNQAKRDTLYNVVKLLGFDPRNANIPCGTDCSALVRVCILYALACLGIVKDITSFRTYNEPAYLKSTGLFEVITDSKYTKHPDYLQEGDILCTPVSGHTVIVLNDGASAHTSSPSPSPSVEILKIGSTGKAVRDLQTKLNSLGFNCGTVDGDFGPKTFDAVKAFQKAAGISVDGEVGTQTQAALVTYKKPEPVVVPPPPAPAPIVIPTTISKGDKGDVVKQLQAALNKHGASLKIDGDFGNLTDSALRDFQKKNGLTVDGICGKNSWTKLLG